MLSKVLFVAALSAANSDELQEKKAELRKLDWLYLVPTEPEQHLTYNEEKAEPTKQDLHHLLGLPEEHPTYRKEHRRKLKEQKLEKRGRQNVYGNLGRDKRS